MRVGKCAKPRILRLRPHQARERYPFDPRIRFQSDSQRESLSVQTISDTYRDLNRQLHIQRPDFGRGGAQWAPTVLQLCTRFETNDVLDYGCGKAMLGDAMPFPVQNYDPCIDGYSARPSPADIVVCTDVLEHIEPTFLDEVLGDIQMLANTAVLLHISTVPAQKELPDGRNAHLIVRPAQWWLERLMALFDVLEWKSEPCVMVGKPKCPSIVTQP